jgi:predicted esterase
MRLLVLLLTGCASTEVYVSAPPPSDASSADVADPMDAEDAAPPDRSKCPTNPDQVGKTKRMYGSGPGYTLYVPKTYDMHVPSALIEVLHGAGDTVPNYLQLWEPVADQRNVIILAPEASSPLSTGFTWLNSDETFILGELDDVASCYSIDPKRRILHGFSAGGVMAYWLGLAKADLFSGIAIFSADLGSAEAVSGMTLLPAPWKIPVSHTHGMDDQNFPISYALASKTRLEAAGHPFYWHPVPGGHTAPATIPNALQAFDDLKSGAAP